MGEEVKINVTASGNVEVISDAEKKLKALKAEQAEYEKAGAPKAAAGVQKTFDKERTADLKLQKEIIEGTRAEMNALRTSGDVAGAAELEAEVALREEALALQKAGVQYESEALLIAREKIAAQAALNEEKLAGQALEKGGSVNPTGPGGMPLRGGRIGNVLSAAGVNRQLAGGIGFAALIGEMVKSRIETLSDEIDAAALNARQEIRHDRREDEKHRRKVDTATGAGERTGLIEADKDEIIGLTNSIEQKKAELNKIQQSWFGRLGLRGQQISTLQGEIEMEEQKRGKFGAEIPGQEGKRNQDIADELALAEARGRHNFLEVRSIQEKLKWTKDYNEALNRFGGKGHEAEASELASMATFQHRQDQMMSIAEHLVNARSGAGDTARAAALADSNSPLRQAIDALHATVRSHGEHITRRDFSSE